MRILASIFSKVPESPHGSGRITVRVADNPVDDCAVVVEDTIVEAIIVIVEKLDSEAKQLEMAVSNERLLLKKPRT